tara:strand:- start:421 stop:720 length:300 start_codon:yes stop_codon:yes gene_type:complete
MIMLYNLVYYFLLFVCVFSILAIVVFAREKDVTTCRLASQILQDKTRICVYVGANYTQWNEYVPIGAGECPREIRCKYRPNEKPFTLKNVIKSIKDSFK